MEKEVERGGGEEVGWKETKKQRHQERDVDRDVDRGKNKERDKRERLVLRSAIPLVPAIECTDVKLIQKL